MSEMRSVVYRTNKIGPSTELCGTPQVRTEMDDLPAAYVLVTAGQVRLEPPVGDNVDSERRLQALQQDWMVDCVESCRKIQEDQRS